MTTIAQLMYASPAWWSHYTAAEERDWLEQRSSFLFYVTFKLSHRILFWLLWTTISMQVTPNSSYPSLSDHFRPRSKVTQCGNPNVSMDAIQHPLPEPLRNIIMGLYLKKSRKSLTLKYIYIHSLFFPAFTSDRNFCVKLPPPLLPPLSIQNSITATPSFSTSNSSK